MGINSGTGFKTQYNIKINNYWKEILKKNYINDEALLICSKR